MGQLTVLSVEDADEKWKAAQLAAIGEQLESLEPGGELVRELEAQQRWLETWEPGSLDAKPLWENQPARKDELSEPILDPNRRAGELRQQLFGAAARPTVKDTQALRKALAETPDDIGIRQLHLHWIDQPQYRKQYADAIARSASQLEAMLRKLQPSSQQIQLARAFCLYRMGRALVYRTLPEVLAEQPLEDFDANDAKLRAAYSQLQGIVGEQPRAEFVLLDVRMLRRDGWYGRALALLESFGSSLKKQWLLKKRRDLLNELGWQVPYQEAARVYQREFPEEVAKEFKAD